MQCAGINRHEAGNERVLRERSSEPLGPSFAVHTARCACPVISAVVTIPPGLQMPFCSQIVSEGDVDR
jgi:hypothetical protein